MDRDRRRATDGEASASVLDMVAAAHARAVRQRSTPQSSMPSGGQPQQYDEAGFPIPQSLPSFAERVRRLLAG